MVKITSAERIEVKIDGPILRMHDDQFVREQTATIERMRKELSNTQQLALENARLRTALKTTFTMRLERDDNIPAFAGFIKAEPMCHQTNAVILMNVEALMSPELESDSGPQEMTREDRKRLLITTVMHEFGHLLEAHLNLPDVEEHIEKACMDWEAAYIRGKEAMEASK